MMPVDDVMPLLDKKAAETLADYINSAYVGFVRRNINGERPLVFSVEVIPGSMSTDVKIGIVSDDRAYVRVVHKASVIDWENYDF